MLVDAQADVLGDAPSDDETDGRGRVAADRRTPLGHRGGDAGDEVGHLGARALIEGFGDLRPPIEEHRGQRFAAQAFAFVHWVKLRRSRGRPRVMSKCGIRKD
jgi:hypothetical protein